MNERERLIERLISEKGGTRQQYLHLLKSITKHESGGDYSIHQKSGGPGRGGYQFEEGKNKGAITAARRTKQYYRELDQPVEKWLEKAVKGDSLDASTLTSEQQDILFLGNMKMHPRADLNKVMTGKESVPDFWANYHWAGKNRDRKARIDNFKETYTPYKAPEITEEGFQKEPLPTQAQDNTYIAPVRQITEVTQPHQRITQQTVQPQDEPNSGNFNDLISYMKGMGVNKQAYGGNASPDYSTNVNTFGNGGSHESNPLGGIPMGMGSNGKQNSVEQGETSFNLKDGKYIFSNRISLDGKVQSSSPTDNKFAEGGNIGDPITPNQKADKTGKDFVTNWMSHPETRKRYRTNMNELEGTNNNRLATDNTTFQKGLTDLKQTTSKFNPTTKNIKGSYQDKNINYYGDVTPGTATHEQTHATGDISNNLSKYAMKKYGLLGSLRDKFPGSSTNEAVQQEFNPATSFGVEDQIKQASYMGSNGELYPRFMEMRQLLNVTPGQPITDDMVNKLIKDPKTNQTARFYTPKRLKEILNTIADNNTNKYQNVAAYGGNFLNTKSKR